MGFTVLSPSSVNQLAIGSFFLALFRELGVSPMLGMLRRKQNCPGAVWLYLAVCIWALDGKHREIPRRAGIPPLPSLLSLLDPRDPHRRGLGWFQSPFDAYNSILQSLPRTACETKEGRPSFYWETFYPLPAAGRCFTVCASLIYDTSCCVAAYLLKLFWFVLVLSCLHMVCV